MQRGMFRLKAASNISNPLRQVPRCTSTSVAVSSCIRIFQLDVRLHRRHSQCRQSARVYSLFPPSPRSGTHVLFSHQRNDPSGVKTILLGNPASHVPAKAYPELGRARWPLRRWELQPRRKACVSFLQNSNQNRTHKEKKDTPCSAVSRIHHAPQLLHSVEQQISLLDTRLVLCVLRVGSVGLHDASHLREKKGGGGGRGKHGAPAHFQPSVASTNVGAKDRYCARTPLTT